MMERQMGRGETRTGGALEMKEEWMGERGDEGKRGDWRTKEVGKRQNMTRINE